MDTYRQLRRQLRLRVRHSLARLIEDGTTVVIAYGGGPANQYGLQSSGAAVVHELEGRGVHAVQIAANSPDGLAQLADLDPGGVAVWVTDPYRYATAPTGRVVRSDLRHDLRAFGLDIASQSLACSAATLFKDETMAVAKKAGLRTISGVRIVQGIADVDSAVRLLKSDRRVVVKPVDGDEGRGVSLVESPGQLLAAVSAIHDQRSDALIEPYIAGTDVSAR